MKNTATRLSTIALLTALAVTPASAVSLNLGGGDAPLVDLGNGNNAGSTVSVDTGTDAGLGVDLNLNGNGSGSGGLLGGKLIDTDGDGPLLDLSPDEGGAVVNLGGSGSGGGTGGTGGLLGLGTGGNVLDLGDGPLLDLNGDDDVDAVVDLDLASTDGAVLDLDGLLGIDSEDGTLLDLGDGALLDLTEDNTELAALDLFDTPVTAVSSLDGDDDPVLDVDIGANDDGVAGTRLLRGVSGAVDVLDGNTVANIDLAQADTGGGDRGTGGGTGGTGGGDDGTGGGDGGNGGDGGTGNNGGDGDDGGNGNNGGGTGTGGGDDDGTGTGTAPAIDVAATGSIGKPRAATGTGEACVDLEGNRLAALQARDYDWATISGWASAQSLRVVEVNVCANVLDTALVALDGSAGITRLQDFFDTQAKVKAGLQQMGHATDDIIAADGQGETLVVYVVGD